ncbi:MAG: hypothetical protein NZ901_04240 [Geminocystis sp.]|nr:hypothetical protein [Geminocystis sp.]HIK38529.1 hypothetical protein [Geminocystis sp. M7585_C2015_104]MCS7147382.1 hypothetical protein [Geminocystis sp.]MCX8079036.1 hypothetical protein [Geminocystis sp.]MDW8117072.1 hypothetical protein [Geminocystis sp.]
MSENSKGENKYTVIELKKSLKRTIVQLEKAIKILNHKPPRDLPSLKVVDDLVKASNALVDYLQLKTENLPPEDSQPQAVEKETAVGSVSKSKNRGVNTNLILVVVLIVSLGFNILTFFSGVVFSGKVVAKTEETSLAGKPRMPEENPNNKLGQTELLESENRENLPSQQPQQDYSQELPLELEKEANLSENQQDYGEEEIQEEVVEETDLANLSPEQFLLKNIEDKLKTITQKYGENMVVKILVDFRENSITIALTDDWQNLKINEKNKLARELFEKAKSLDLHKFSLQDSRGNVLARSAVVGDNVIIMK